MVGQRHHDKQLIIKHTVVEGHEDVSPRPVVVARYEEVRSGNLPVSAPAFLFVARTEANPFNSARQLIILGGPAEDLTEPARIADDSVIIRGPSPSKLADEFVFHLRTRTGVVLLTR